MCTLNAQLLEGGGEKGTRDRNRQESEFQRFLRKAMQGSGRTNILGRSDSTSKRTAWCF